MKFPQIVLSFCLLSLNYLVFGMNPSLSQTSLNGINTPMPSPKSVTQKNIKFSTEKPFSFDELSKTSKNQQTPNPKMYFQINKLNQAYRKSSVSEETFFATICNFVWFVSGDNNF